MKWMLLTEYSPPPWLFQQKFYHSLGNEKHKVKEKPFPTPRKGSTVKKAKRAKKKLVGGWTNPFEKNESNWKSSPSFGVKIPKLFELPPPRKPIPTGPTIRPSWSPGILK